MDKYHYSFTEEDKDCYSNFYYSKELNKKWNMPGYAVVGKYGEVMQFTNNLISNGALFILARDCLPRITFFCFFHFIVRFKWISYGKKQASFLT